MNPTTNRFDSFGRNSQSGIRFMVTSNVTNAAATLVGVSCQSVCSWILKIGDLEKLLPKPSGELVCLELDGLCCIFLKTKRISFGYGKPLVEKQGHWSRLNKVIEILQRSC